MRQRFLYNCCFPFRHRKICLRYSSSKASHHDLESFLAYANTTNLSTVSTYYRGTLYEYTVLQALRGFNICLHRTGGTDDKGLDLRGRWVLPHHNNYSEGIPVVVQCKAEKKPVGPKYMRELEGATTAEDPDTIVLLAALSRSTLGARKVMMGSEKAMGMIAVQTYEEGGQVVQFMWNAAAARILGSGLGVKLVFDSSLSDDEDDERHGRVALTCDGRVIKMKKHIPGAN